MSMIRSRWAALGAAVAVTLGGGGVGLVGATVSSGEGSVFVPVTPCRIVDTRPSFQTGPRGMPLGPGETHTISAHGTNGDCTIPTEAVGLSMNVTTVEATLPTFLTIWATGEPMPNASSLNPASGQPPTPNAVTTELSAGGEFDIYNLQGNVHVIADVNGYYTDHDHDDRYYTKAEIDALHAGQTRFVSVPPTEFQPRYPGVTTSWIGAVGELYVVAGTQDEFYAPVHLPDGVVIEALYAWVRDSSLFDSPARNLNIALYGLEYDGGYTKMFDLLSGFQPTPTKLTDNTPLSRGPQLVDNDSWMYVVSVDVPASNWADYGNVLELHGVIVEYTVAP